MTLRTVALLVPCLTFALITDAQAMRTTYFWGIDSESDRGDSLFHDCQELATAALFPELCGANGPALLSVTFAHGDAIPNWSTNGCGEAMPDLCVPIVYDTILRVDISRYTRFTPNEVLVFEGEDFLGACPVGVVACDRAPPFISIDAIDAATETQIAGFGFGGQFWTIALSFADGRQYEWGGFWSRGLTVLEPSSAAMMVLGLAGMIFVRRRRTSRA